MVNRAPGHSSAWLVSMASTASGWASRCPMPSIRILPGRLPSGVGRCGRRNAQKAPHKAAKDPYEPDLLGPLCRLRLTSLRRIPTTGAARTGCRGATNGQPNQQAFHQRSGHNCRYKEEFHRRTSEPSRRTVRRCRTIPVMFGRPPATCPPAWRHGSARPGRAVGFAHRGEAGVEAGNPTNHCRRA